MNSTPVTVVMPAFNAERFIGDAIRSILAQTHECLSLIVFNDGSTDETLNIINKFRAEDKRVKVVSAANRGYSRCLVDLLSITDSEFVARMDADDIALPDRIRMQVAYLERNQDCVVVGGAIEAIDQFGDPLATVRYPTDHQAIVHSLFDLGKCSIAHPAAMIRKSEYFKVGGYRVDFEPAEDYDLWLRLAEIGKLANLRDVVLRYRVHGSSASSTRSKLQNENTKRAHSEGCSRKGVANFNPFEESDSNSPIQRSDFQTLVFFANMATDGGFGLTALRYVRRLVRHYPFRIQTWRCLVRVLLKSVASKQQAVIRKGSR